MISNFEKALNRDEFPEYFRGSGIYFTKDHDWGTQLHVINWQGLCGFLKTQKNPVATLKSAFEKHLKTITNSMDDANDLLENIGCYYYMRKKIPTLSENGFDLIRDLSNNEKQIISNCMEFLYQEIYKSNNAQDIETYNRRITKLANDDGPNNFRSL